MKTRPLPFQAEHLMQRRAAFAIRDFATGSSSPWQNCGTGVSPVFHHGRDARATRGFAAGSRLLCVVAAVLALGVNMAAFGQTVEVQIPSTEAFVGEGLAVRVIVSNMSEQVDPMPPETKDFEIRSDPGNPVGRSQRISIINGRRTQSVDYTYLYQVRPLRTGRPVLPPFTVTYKGRVYHTQQIPIRVSKDTSSEYMFCRIKADIESAYVGQPVELTLEIWVQQYSQQGVELDAGNMWNLRDMQATSPGVFDQVDWGRPRYYEATRKNDEGMPEQYYVFLLETTVYPTKAGPYDFGDVAVAYNYPKRLGRDNFFFSRWQVTDSRRLRAPAKAPRLEIKPIPTKDRPADFNGAIGRHTIVTEAKPTEVPVGDPITLTLEIRGVGALEQLQPPKLDQVEALTRDFEVSSESLAGEIHGRRKTFSQTIRALREDVTEIPPIPLSYFDTDAGRFQTVWSKAIPIMVSPAERLAISTLSGPGSSAAVLVPLVESTEGLLANDYDTDALLANQSGEIGMGAWILLAAMPLVYLMTWFVQRRAARYRDDVSLRRRSRAYATARKALKGVKMRRTDAGDSPAGTARSALIGYIADRCNVPTGGLTRADVVRLITERGIPTETIRAVDTLLASLELAQYGGTAGGTLHEVATSARRLVDELL